MPHYSYTAYGDDGASVRGVLESPDKSAAVDQLLAKGLSPTKLETAGQRAGGGILDFGSNRWSRSDLLVFTQSLATTLSAGMPLERTLTLLVSILEKSAMIQTVEAVLSHLREGAGFADALADQNATFPKYYVSVIRAGESGGDLAQVVGELSDYLAKSERLNQQVRSSLIYPAFLLAMILGTMSIVIGYVVPQFKPMFENARVALPVSTQFVIGLGDWFSENWLLLGATIVVLVLGVRILLRYRNLRIVVDRWMWHSLFGLVAKTETARFCRTLGQLLSSGVPLANALAICNDVVANLATRSALEDVSLKIREGAGLSASLEQTELMPSLAMQLIRVGEETGKLSEMLKKTSIIYDQEVATALERLVALLVPVLTILMGGIVAALIGSVIVGILSINDLAL